MGTPYKMKGSPMARNFGIGSPLHQDKAFDQKKIKNVTRTNPSSNKEETVNKGYNADIDDIRKAKLVSNMASDMSENQGTRSGVTSGGAADKLGYSGRAGGASMLGKGIFEPKYNVGEYGRIEGSRGTQGGDTDIAKNIRLSNNLDLVKPINLNVEAESTTKGLRLNTKKKKKKSEVKKPSTKINKLAYAKSQLKVKKK
tara:strand:- start:51 stop:647 length:597 start_codon:yes stop_codon:yes gene_type:complete